VFWGLPKITQKLQNNFPLLGLLWIVWHILGDQEYCIRPNKTTICNANSLWMAKCVHSINILEQIFGISKYSTRKFFKDDKLHSHMGSCNFISLWKNYSCLLITNSTQNHVISCRETGDVLQSYQDMVWQWMIFGIDKLVNNMPQKLTNFQFKYKILNMLILISESVYHIGLEDTVELSLSTLISSTDTTKHRMCNFLKNSTKF